MNRRALMFSMVICYLVFGCSQLAFVSRESGTGQIYKMNSAGRDRTDLTNNEFENSDPDVSADGRRITFSSRQGSTQHIFVIDADGSDLRQGTSGGEEGAGRRWPKWSPGGESIAFSYPYHGRADNGPAYHGHPRIWTIEPDGTGLRHVTRPAPEEEDAGQDFYQGGKMLVFSRLDRTTKDRDLYTTYYDGSQVVTRITNTPDFREGVPEVSLRRAAGSLPCQPTHALSTFRQSGQPARLHPRQRRAPEASRHGADLGNLVLSR